MEFKGVESPEVYLVDFHQEENPLEIYPMSGIRGDFVSSLLGSFSLLSSVRFANWTMQGEETVVKDIERTQPKVVVAFGAQAATLVGSSRKITDISGEVFDHKFGEYETKVLVLVSPSYVLHHLDNATATIEFSQGLYKAFQIINGEWIDILKEKEILSAHSFDEFKEICETRFAEDKIVAYDIETNARPPLMKGSEIIGFSVGNKNSGVYVSHDSLDFHMPQNEIDQIWDYVINNIFDAKDKLIIHNTMYERPYTLYCKNYEIGYEKAEDTLVMARLLKGAKEGAGLKYQAQKNLHYPDWETDLGRYISGIRGLIERIGLGPKKFNGIYTEIENGVSIFELGTTESFDDLREEDKEEVKGIVEKLYSTVVELYDENEIINLGILIGEKVVSAVQEGGITDSTIPYNWIPDRVLSKYGAVDSLATYDLYDFFTEMMDKDSTDKVDLHKGYENWLEHIYVAYIMERNGMYWNDDMAQRDREMLSEQATECLRSMLKSPVFKFKINDVCDWKYRPIILSDYLPHVARQQGFEVSYDRETDKYTVKYNGKRCAKGRIGEIQIPQKYQQEYNDLIHQMFYEEVDRASTFEELKELYNPSSSSMSDVPRQILMTPDLQMGGRVVELNTLSESPEFEEVKDLLPAIDKKFLSVASLLCSADKLKEMYGDDWASNRKALFKGFCNLYESSRHLVTTPEILEILNQTEPVQIESFDDGGIIRVYDNLVVTGMDQDDKSTWTPEFEWMVNFRLFKKSSKIITSYIDGTVGRQSVAVCDKESLQRGDHRVERKRKYFEGTSDTPDGSHVPCRNDEDYLLMAKWSPNTAETGRWRSAQHTVPWGSQVKKYYTSRFKGGTTCCPDYSQMEVRTLAAISKDKNMLDLFFSGKDFHTETAKKIYRKDEVTTAERRFSKTATFSLLYGAMEESFAHNYCKDDMDYAHMVYGGFFEAYPDVKRWVDERHEEVQRDHRVSLELSNRFIQIPLIGEGKGAVNSMLRKAQNYPIQAQSADLTGCVIFDLQKYIEENHLKSLIFMYVHDSIEVDIYPYELLQFIAKLKILLNESPMERMGLPSKADVALGKSLGHEIELEEIEMNEEMTEGTLTLKGYKDEIDETVETWKEAYAVVEVSEEKWKEEFVSMGELFILRKAYTPTLGTLRHKGTCKVHIKYYED